LTSQALKEWRTGSLLVGKINPDGTSEGSTEKLHLFPSRPSKPLLVEAHKILNPKEAAKFYKVSLPVVLLHTIGHIELTAVDMYWDTLIRFSGDSPVIESENEKEIRKGLEIERKKNALKQVSIWGSEYNLVDKDTGYFQGMEDVQNSSQFWNQMPREYYDDFLRVAYEETTHLELILNRLKELDTDYGIIDCHKNLWEHGIVTRY